MRPKDCAYIVERLAIRFMAMVADHERQLAEHRTSFGARTEADAKIIARLRSEVEASEGECNVLRPLVVDAAKYKTERDGLLTQVHDMRAEITRLTGNYDLLRQECDKALTLCETDEQTPAECIGSLNARIDRLQDDARSDAKVREELHRINVELRAEVAALQERLRASIARGDFAQMELAQLKSPTPKHPVAVGGYLRRLTGFNTTPAGEVARVTLVDDDDPSQLEYEVVRPNGQKGRWSAKGCEPCDPPEATHDTEAGKAAAEAALKTEPVTDEIKVGDLVEVFQKTGNCTFETDIGTRGTVLLMEDSCVETAPLEGYRSPKGNHVALCDVRKVTT